MTENTQIVKTTGSSLTAFLTNNAAKNQIAKIVGGKDSDRFISSLMSAVQATPALSECTNQSLVNAALLGYSLKLSPSPQLGQFWMVPYDNRKTKVKEAQFQLGYKGYIQLATRSGNYRKLTAIEIKEGELVKFNPLFEEFDANIIEDPDVREKAKTIGYFAMFEYTNGFRKVLYWSKEKMISHADRYSAAFSKDATPNVRYPKVSFADFEAEKYSKKDSWLYSSPWYSDFDGMALKTMLRQLISKWGIMSIDMQQAFCADQAVINDDNQYDYVDQSLTSVDREIEENANSKTIDISEMPSEVAEPTQMSLEDIKADNPPQTDAKTQEKANMGF